MWFLLLLLVPQVEIGPCAPATDAVRIEVRAWPGPGAREARLAMWREFVRGARKICFAGPAEAESADMRALRETAGVITRNQALFAPLAPRAMGNETLTIEPAGAVRVHILESRDAMAIVALNESPQTRRVKLTFPLSIPEAIWQDMEAGRAVHFVMEKDGPAYTHTFAGHDVLVLAIRKTLR